MPEYRPVVKWPGSKKSVAPAIACLFPASRRFFDPFVGGGAILPYRNSLETVAGDVIDELIALWQLIQASPETVVKGYADRWLRRRDEGHTAYYEIRRRFNENRDPLDLLFLSRTCVNGLIRFNAAGEFNNSLHHTRPGIDPDRLAQIIYKWQRAIQHVSFRAADYRDTLDDARKGDLVFLDPPYASTKGRYRRGTFSLQAFLLELARMNSRGIRWVLTFDGRAGGRIYDTSIPDDLYKHRLSMSTGNSPFPRLMGGNIDAVTESVYLNFDPSSEALTQFAHRGLQRPPFKAGHNVQQALFLSGNELDSQDDVHFRTNQGTPQFVARPIAESCAG